MASIDLHGRTWPESLSELIETYNRILTTGSPSQILEVVHGYGSSGTGGSLRRRVRSFLAAHSDRLQFKPGEESDGNPGHTIVVPIQPLPEVNDLLAEQVLEYCETARTQSKITGKFRRYGDPRVIQAIRSLEKQGRIRSVTRGRNKAYEGV
jgi:hypothetical protein